MTGSRVRVGRLGVTRRQLTTGMCIAVLAGCVFVLAAAAFKASMYGNGTVLLVSLVIVLLVQVGINLILHGSQRRPHPPTDEHANEGASR